MSVVRGSAGIAPLGQKINSGDKVVSLVHPSTDDRQLAKPFEGPSREVDLIATATIRRGPSPALSQTVLGRKNPKPQIRPRPPPHQST